MRVVRLPFRAIGDNILHDRDGRMLAAWRLTPENVRYASRSAKDDLFAKVEAGAMGLPARAELVSVCRLVDPAEIVEQMMAGVIDRPEDADRYPGWAARCQETLEYLVAMAEEREILRPRRRQTYLICELPTSVTSWRRALQLGVGWLTAGLVAPPPPSRNERERAALLADSLEARLGGRFGLISASAGELRWVLARARKRALGDEPVYGPAWEPLDGWAEVLRPLGDAVLNHPDDLPRTKVALRYLPVRSWTRDEQPETSYQAVLLASDLPAAWIYPGGELFSRLDELPFALDWKVWLQADDNQAAQRATRKQVRQLLDQLDEREGDPVDLPTDLELARRDLIDAQAALTEHRGTPQFRVTIALVVAAPTLEELRRRIGQTKDLLDPGGVDVAAVTAGQEPLYLATLPGMPVPADLHRDYCRVLHADGLAGLMPMATEHVGDDRGLFVGWILDAGTLRPVLLDPDPHPGHDVSKSIAFTGVPGSGKSYAAKRCACDVLLRGGRVVALDRTAKREWSRFAAAVGGQVVELREDTELSLDPLRVFPNRADAERYAIDALTILTGVAPRSFEGMELTQAVRVVLSRPTPRLLDVVDVLRARAEEEPALRYIHRQLETLAGGSGIARMLFGDGPALDLDAACIVFSAADMRLPKRGSSPESWHLEEAAGLALLYLVAAITGITVIRDPRFGVAIFDEAYFLTDTDHSWGLDLLVQLGRDGRKEHAALWVISQFTEDLVDPRLRGLFGYVFCGKQTTRDGAVASLELLGAEVGERTVKRVLHLNDRSRPDEPAEPKGQFLFRDSRGQIALVQFAAETDPERHEAYRTDTTTAAEVAA
jgi:AAA-like domain